MMSLYGQYIAEREGKHIVEDSVGFATYQFLPDLGAVYIENIFVREESRQRGVAAGYADKIADIAKAQNYKKLLGSVKPSANGSTSSLKVLLSYGFELLSSEQDAIWLKKEL